jgi:hypothetical protein
MAWCQVVWQSALVRCYFDGKRLQAGRIPAGTILSDWLPIQSKPTCLLHLVDLESWGKTRKVRHLGDSTTVARFEQL